MVQVPPEIKALIVDEIWHGGDPEPSLSALGQVWKDALPFIRSHRFNDVHVSRTGLPRLLALKDNTTHPFTLIRKLTVNADDSGATMVILDAINVEDLTYYVPRYNDELRTLATHTNLAKLTLPYGDLEFSTLMDLLHSIPRLTSLTLSDFCLVDFYYAAEGIWPTEYEDCDWDPCSNHEHCILEECVPLPQWEAYKFPDSDPLPNISHLSLDITRAEHLWFFDFVCSPKSPFRDLRHISLSDSTDSFLDVRVGALLKKYSSSLIEFELRTDVDGFEDCSFAPFRLTLPAGVQHYKFFVDVREVKHYMRPDILYDNLKSSCATLKRVTMRIRLGGPDRIISDKNAELDRALVSLDLRRFDVNVDINSTAGVEVGQEDEYAREQVAQIFPLMMEKFFEGGAGGKIFWTYQKSL